jgi:hypothetical protein
MTGQLAVVYREHYIFGLSLGKWEPLTLSKSNTNHVDKSLSELLYIWYILLSQHHIDNTNSPSVFRAQADWALIHMSHRETEQSTIEASITLGGVTLNDSLIGWSPNEWPSVCWEITVSADKMFWTANKPAQWTLYTIAFASWIIF